MKSPANKPVSLWIVIWFLLSAGLVYAVFSRASDADRAVATNTICLGVFAAAIAIPLGALAAWAASKRGWLSRAVLISCVASLVVPVFVHVSAWDSAFGRLGWLSAEQGEVLQPIVTGWTAAVWIHAVAAVPQVAVIFLLGLLLGRRTFEEQALLETSRSSVFWHVTFPRLIPLVLLSAVWILVGCAREIAVTDIYRIGTLAEQVYLGFSLGQFNSIQGNWTPEQINDAQSLGPLVTIAVIGWIIITGTWFFARVTDWEYESGHWRPDKIGKHSSSTVARIVAVLTLVVLVFVPIGNLFYRASFLVISLDGSPTTTHSFAQLIAGLSRVLTQYQTEFTWSTIIATVSSTLIVLVVTLLTWLACRSRIWKFVFVFALTVCCAIPGPLFGSWLSTMLSSLTQPFFVWLYDRTIFAPVVATIFFCWPLSGLITWFAFRKTANDCIENSRLEGANWFHQLFGIILAGNKRVLLGCWLLSFALCFGELSTSQMVLPPGMDTVPRTTLGLLHAGVDEITAALTIVTVALIIVISLIGWWLVGLKPAENHRK